jgi:hypothetical protein
VITTNPNSIFQSTSPNTENGRNRFLQETRAQFCVAIILLGMLFSGGCNVEEAKSPSSRSDLTPKEFQKHVNLANRGNADSAYRLATYYMDRTHDTREALFWLERAKDLGMVSATQEIFILEQTLAQESEENE